MNEAKIIVNGKLYKDFSQVTCGRVQHIGGRSLLMHNIQVININGMVLFEIHETHDLTDFEDLFRFLNQYGSVRDMGDALQTDEEFSAVELGFYCKKGWNSGCGEQCAKCDNFMGPGAN
jgi:hypothetical protein